MSNLFIILLMVFCHIVDDYYLQGWLATAKQKRYWEDNSPQKLYKYDYIWALLMHSFSWAFMIMLPIAYIKGFDLGISFAIAFIINLVIHAFTDDLKANKLKINLWIDQTIHLCQIALTAIIFLH